MRIGVLIASFNRKEKTLACLKQLTGQKLPEHISLEIHLTDDDSPDGTAEAVRQAFPQVHVYQGDGELYWAGGMRKSWKNALPTEPDYYLLLNDDVFLLEDAIERLVACSRQYLEEKNKPAICVGPTRDETGKVSYGGRRLYTKYRPQHYLVHSEEHYLDCDLGDGNIMLIPAAVVEKIGIFSEEWVHGIADFDYSNRAKAAGFGLIAAPGIFGVCTYDRPKRWKSSDVKFSERLEFLYSPTGLQYPQCLRYVRKYHPLNLPISFLKVWTKTLLPIVYDKFKK